MQTLDKTMKQEFFVEGMHCAACELLIEKKLSKHQDVNKVDAVLADKKVYLDIKPGVDQTLLQEELTALIKDEGYVLKTESKQKTHSQSETINSLIIAAIIFGIFLLIQRLGVLDLINPDQISLPFIFFIGVVASLSTCMAVVGGLVLSISGTYAKEKQLKPLVIFHISRLVSFFILGGLIGILGSAFVLTATSSFILNLVLFFFMLVLGLNMLEMFPALSKFQLRLPKSLGKNALKLESTKNFFTPILLGAATFVLPCGFTQSMQLYSLTTANFFSGAITMLVFALGTLPVLALISFASVKFANTFRSGIFYKTAGFIVILFALMNFTNALAAVGLISPVFGF